MFATKNLRVAAHFLFLNVVLLPMLTHASDATTSACAIVSKQTCGDCDLDTPSLRSAIATLKIERVTLAISDTAVLKVDLCLLRGLHALSAIHLAPQRGKALSQEREQVLAAIKVEQKRLLKLYPNNKEVLNTVLAIGSLPNDTSFRAYAALSALDKTNADAAFWAGFYALQTNDPSWRSRMSASMRSLKNAQLFRQFVDILLDVARSCQCDTHSLQLLDALRANVDKAWQGIDGDTEAMTPKMLALSSKFAVDVTSLRCAGDKTPK